MAKSFWDEEVEVISIPKNGRGEEIKVKKVSKSGKIFIDVRTFYPGAGGELLPGKGISIPEDCSAQVVEAIIKCQDIEI